MEVVSPSLVTPGLHVWRRAALPTTEQSLLLHAALAEEPAEALTAWEQWRASVDIENLDHGSHRLLPLLHRNLVRHQAAPDPWLNRMKGVHRYYWVQNHRLFARVSQLVERVRQELDTPVMLLKGAALAMRFYPDLGLRPMADCDLLVRPEMVARVLALLERRGWRALHGWENTRRPLAGMTARWQSFHHAQGFIADGAAPSGNAIEIDVHWRALGNMGCGPELNESLWTRAVTARLPDGPPIYTPDATDLFAHVCFHGLHTNIVPPVRWVADATVLIRRTIATAGDAPPIDWQRLFRLAADGAATLRLHAALCFLADQRFVPVPPEFLAQLRAHPVSPEEEAEFRMVVDGEPALAAGFGGRMAYRLHRLRCPAERNPGGPVAGWRHAADYLCGRWNVRSPLGLPLVMVQYGARRLWRLAAWRLRGGVAR